MGSNSIRISGDLFEHARQEGLICSRSAAQQIEHWAKIGAAFESSGASADEIKAILCSVLDFSEDDGGDLWDFKRKMQKIDIENMRAGKLKQVQLAWFKNGITRKLKIPNSCY